MAVEVVALGVVEFELIQVERVPVGCCARDSAPFVHIREPKPQRCSHGRYPEAGFLHLPRVAVALCQVQLSPSRM
eukprot:7122776-Lingulodinium_polyedra.AAC.1